MKFESILIITYGRSGSTLLQGVLNSHEEILIRGENFNFCFGLFESYKAIQQTRRKTKAIGPEKAFFGAPFMDDIYYISTVKKMVKKLLLGDQIENNRLRCYGFKEIRYEKHPDEIEEYLSFLKKIFPNPAFVFNTRDKKAVLHSRSQLNWKDQIDMELLIKTEEAFRDYFINNSDSSFHLTYEDVIGKSDRLAQLFSFLGITYSDEKISRVLGIQHSYRPVQVNTSKLERPIRKVDKLSGVFRIKNEDNDIAKLESELLKVNHKLKISESSFFNKVWGFLTSNKES